MFRLLNLIQPTITNDSQDEVETDPGRRQKQPQDPDVPSSDHKRPGGRRGGEYPYFTNNRPCEQSGPSG